MDRSDSKRVGVFGGTFDPIHYGHLRPALEVFQACSLDELYFMPAAVPPHKQQRPVSPAAMRLAMIDLAVSGTPGFYSSSYELDKGGTSYSIDTLSAFQNVIGGRLFFIVGRDAFADIATWKSYGNLFGVANFIVMSRAGIESKGVDAGNLEVFPVAIRGDFCYEGEGAYRHRSGNLVLFQSVTRFDISSSMIRGERLAGRSIAYLVPAAVEHYIREHDLYLS